MPYDLISWQIIVRLRDRDSRSGLKVLGTPIYSNRRLEETFILLSCRQYSDALPPRGEAVQRPFHQAAISKVQKMWPTLQKARSEHYDHLSKSIPG